jgi:spermidine synthase
MPSIQVSERQGVRYLHFGSELVQGAMRIGRPWSLELQYTRELLLPLHMRRERDWPRKVLLVGLGSASIAKYLYRNRPRARITVIEILPEVVAAARAYFRLPDDPARLRIEIGDGHDYLARRRRRFDLIVVDGFDGDGHAGMLETVPFYVNCRAALAEDGMLSANLLDRSRGPRSAIGRLREAFDGKVLVLPREEGGNTIALATTGEFGTIPPRFR